MLGRTREARLGGLGEARLGGLGRRAWEDCGGALGPAVGSSGTVLSLPCGMFWAAGRISDEVHVLKLDIFTFCTQMECT